MQIKISPYGINGENSSKLFTGTALSFWAGRLNLKFYFTGLGNRWVFWGEKDRYLKKERQVFFMRGKRGWTRILEATIAVMLVAGVMLVSYSGQIERDSSVAEYSQSWQREILGNIVSRIDLRLNVLNVLNNSLDDVNYVILNDFVMSKVPNAFGYLLRICELGSLDDYCKMDSISYIATLENDVFVEEVVVSAEIGNGTGGETYSPKKVRLFFWEGGFPEDSCESSCTVEGFSVNSCSGNNVTRKTCEDSNGAGCLKYDDGVFVNDCGSEACFGGACVVAEVGYHELSCGKEIVVDWGCVSNFDDECDIYDGGRKIDDCGFWRNKEEYECWNIDTQVTDCEENPVCSVGYDEVSSSVCTLVVPCSSKCTENLRFCSDDNLSVMEKVCGDHTGDDCKEYSSVDVLFDSCEEGEVCFGGNCVVEVVGCMSDCSVNSAICSTNNKKIIKRTCGNYDDDSCLEFGSTDIEWCRSDEECFEGECFTSDCEECSADEFVCSADLSSINKRTCGNYDADSCLDYSGVIIIPCDEGKVCSGGDCITEISAIASLSLGFSDVNYSWEDPQHYYYYTRTFSESNGVGVTLTNGELCFETLGICNPATINYRIEAGGSLVNSGENFATTYASESFTLTYGGTDDNGNSVSVEAVANVAGSSWLS